MKDDLDLRNLPGLKAREIGRTISGEGVAAQGPIFYRVTVEQYALDRRAIERQHGLELHLGSHVLASVMGPDEDMAKLMQKSTVFLGMQDAVMMPVAALLGEGKE